MTDAVCHSLVDMDEYERRKDEIRLLQVERGMAPRPDSKLSDQYARGLLPHTTAEEVVDELISVHQIFVYTRYDQVLEETMRCLASLVKDTYHLTWTQTWTIVRFYAPTMLKLWCLEENGVKLRRDILTSDS